MVEIMEGRRLVHAHSYRADEILQLLRTAEEFGFRIQTLQHVLEGYKIADEIAKHGRRPPRPSRTGGPTKSRPTMPSRTTRHS